ncbi:MAG: GTPase, partial [Planctomycetota bacterium]
MSAQHPKHREQEAANLVAQCTRLEEDGLLPPSASWLAKFHDVKKAARAVLAKAQSPVKIGVVGEFSAGKSLLLGSLIGYADCLPVSELPTTGNVTALNFTPVSDLTSTEVGPYQIYFLDHEGFYECLQFMLNEAARRARQAELPAMLVDKLAGLRANDESIQEIETWCKQAWTATQNPSLRYLVRELIAYLRAYKHAGVGLCGSPEPFEVAVDIAKAGLELPIVEQNIQAMTFGELPVPPIKISSRPESLTADLIRIGFPLIRLVSVNVRVSMQIWNLGNLSGDNRFVLLDFPGLGADSSGVRDLFLCLRELEQIQTILILLNGKKPGGDQASKLYDL